MSSQPTQSKTIRAQLLTAMKEGEYAACERLPRESVLAEKLGISRTQLRDILASLEREGFIYTVAGKGCFVSQKSSGMVYEEHLKKIEEHMGEIARLAGSSGITEGQLIEMYRVLQEENR